LDVSEDGSGILSITEGAIAAAEDVDIGSVASAPKIGSSSSSSFSAAIDINTEEGLLASAVGD
jgi:hypothetical protein